MLREDFVDYYQVLGVSRDATMDEIKRSFRRLAMKFHPDRNRSAPKWADEKIRLIIKAYDVLGDDKHRQVYDGFLDTHFAGRDIGAEAFARDNPDDPAAQARLVLQRLLDQRFDEGLKIYGELLKQHGPHLSLRAYLSERDYLDCLFLLGEGYERNGSWARALEFYEKVYYLEREHPVRYFLEEVKERIKDIYCKCLARRSSPTQAIAVYKKVLEMDVPKKSEAYICKKIAECYFKLSNIRKAKEYLARALNLEPHLKGAQKICEKLGMSEHLERLRQSG